MKAKMTTKLLRVLLALALLAGLTPLTALPAQAEVQTGKLYV